MRGASQKKGRFRWRIILPLWAVGALVLAGVAGAANSASYADPAGDSGLAADITNVAVANDSGGTITIRLAFASRGLTPGLPGEQLGVALDLDQNPDTGTVYDGTEVAFSLDFGVNGDTLKFMRAARSEFTAAAAPPSLKATTDGDTGAVTFSVDAADLGLAPTGGFNFVAISASSVTTDGDLAPGQRTFNYQLVAGASPPPLRPDTRAPLDHAIASSGVHGQVARLAYTAQDGRAVTADTLRVYRRNRLLRTISIRLGDTNPFLTYDIRWRVPGAVRGRLRFCVQSVDAAGNKSNLSCAPLMIR